MIKVFYSDKMVVDQGEQGFGDHVIKSPSALKPMLLFRELKKLSRVPGHSSTKRSKFPLEFVEPTAMHIGRIKLAHSSNYVDRIFSLEEDNGFGNRSDAVNESLRYTNGAMYDAAQAATPENPTCALVSGFHHAGYNGWKNFGYFCTFNGLAITAIKRALDKQSTLILDCDMHLGNGTDDILTEWSDYPISHITFGKYFFSPRQAQAYLQAIDIDVREFLVKNRPELIIYQAGADVHVDDPYGGVLTTEQIYERDLKVFRLAKEFGIPIAWNLAGGYQVDENGNPTKVIEIHVNTFRACMEVYGENHSC